VGESVNSVRGTQLHVVAGSQAQNMQRMGRRCRGGGRPAFPRRGHALAARRALLGSDDPTLW